MTKYTAILFCFLCTALVLAMSANLTYAEEVKKVKYCLTYCGCSEASLLERRIAEVEGAIKGFEASKSGREKVMFSQSEYSKVSGDVQKAINSELKSRGLEGFGEGAATHPATCGITIKYNGSPCVKEGLRRHEKIHQDVCIEKTGRVGAAGSVSGIIEGLRGSGVQADYRHGMTATEFIQEELSGYNTELAFLKSERDTLKRVCRTITLEFNSADSVFGAGRSGEGAYKGGGRAYTCERKRLTHIGSDTETWKALKKIFGN